MNLDRHDLRLVGLLAFLSTFGCGDDGSSTSNSADCVDAKCDNTEGVEDGADLTCAELTLDKSGLGLDFAGIAAQDDPFAEHILSAEGFCQLSVADITEALLAAGCTNHGTQFISERSQLLGTFTDYRTVTDLTCNGQTIFLHFALRANEVSDASGISEELLQQHLDHAFPAIMSEKSDHTFNFYQSRNLVHRVCVPRGDFEVVDDLNALTSCEATSECGDGEQCLTRPDALGVEADIRYFGSSMDFINLPDRRATFEAMAGVFSEPVSTEADVDHSLDIERNCAACHPNGGLTMRELESPWVHWEHPAHFLSPGTSELIEKSGGILGSHKDGLVFERTVKSHNQDFNQSRVAQTLQLAGAGTMTTGQVLRPLFCSDEFNIDTTAEVAGEPLSRIPFTGPIVERNANRFGRINVSDSDFKAEIEAAGWKLWGFELGAFGNAPAPTETIGTLTFMHRAQIDEDYQRVLVSDTVIDQELADDILSIDFTRPIFSEERCQLIEWADRVPTSAWLSPEGIVAENSGRIISERMAEELTNAGVLTVAETDFLQNLVEDEDSIRNDASAFTAACEDRDPAELLTDYVRFMGQMRKRAGHTETALELGEASFLQFAFPGANGFLMPEAVTQGFEHGLRFDPADCQLINHYPGAEPIIDEPEAPPVPGEDPTEPGTEIPQGLSCVERGCSFDEGFPCQCDEACIDEGDCCDFDGDPDNFLDEDGPSLDCDF